MALSANTVWELRTDAVDTNGGGFVAGATGIDYSQQAAAQFSGTNLTVDATTNTDVLPDGHTPDANDVGNLIQITTTGSGAAFTIGFYQIASIQSGKWRLDRSPAAVNSTGATWAMGGAMKSPALVLKSPGAIVAGNTVWLRGGSSPSSNPFLINVDTISVAGGRVQLISVRNYLRGYGTIRGDGVRAVVKLGVTTAGVMWNNISSGFARDLEFDGNKANFTCGSPGAGNVGIGYNLLIHDFSGGGCLTGLAIGCESYNNGTYGFSSGSAFYCSAYNNGAAGFDGGSVFNCVSYSNGTSGYSNLGGSAIWFASVAYKNGTTGFAGAASFSQMAINCISYGNSTYGFTGGDAFQALINCAYGNNTLGNIQTAMIEIGSISLPTDPFVNGAGRNFALNNTAGGGLPLQGTGYGTIGTDGLTTSFPNIGAVQSVIARIVTAIIQPTQGLCPGNAELYGFTWFPLSDCPGISV